MDTMEVIRQRRSIRKFTDRQVSRDVLESILDAGLWAPSGQNLQPWYFVALTEASEIAFVAESLETTIFDHRQVLSARFKNNPEVVEETLDFDRTLGGARTIILAFLKSASYGEDERSCRASVAAAMENMCLAATSMGVATCWVESVCRVSEGVHARYAPDKGDLVGAVIVGYPAVEAKTPKRKDGRFIIR